MGLVAFIAGAFVTTALATAHVSRSQQIFVASNRCRGHVDRPKHITLDCFHGSMTVSGLRYMSYGGRTAHAKGFFSMSCGKNCGGMSFTHLPGTVTLSDTIVCDGRRYYGQISWSYNGTSANGSRGSSAGGFGAGMIGPSKHCRDYWRG